MDLKVTNNNFTGKNNSIHKSLNSKTSFNKSFSKITEKKDSDEKIESNRDLNNTMQFIKNEHGLVSEVCINGIKMSAYDALMLRGESLKRCIETKYSKSDAEILKKAFNL